VRIFYVHGFGSSFRAHSRKMEALRMLGPVHGLTVDWTDPVEALSELTSEIQRWKPDLIVGTSMGGWGANQLGTSLGIKWIALNPVTNPAEQLRHRVGDGYFYDGTPYTMDEFAIKYLSPFVDDLDDFFQGMMVVENGDEVLDHSGVFDKYYGKFTVIGYNQGNHQFDDIYRLVTQTIPDWIQSESNAKGLVAR